MSQEPVREFMVVEEQEGLGPVARLCNLILSEAILTGAGRIRLQREDAVKGGVEYEAAGTWRPVMQIPSQAFVALINHLKDMAGLNDSAHESQAGEIRVRLNGALRVLPVAIELTGNDEIITLIVSNPSAT